MAITINGTGTITGLTAGGLPDGSVATDDIANNAVTAGKLATTLDLTGKTVTLPSGTGGKILQVKTTIYTTQTSLSTAAATLTDLPFSVAITPSNTNNIILVSYSLMGEYSGHPWNVQGAFSRTVGGTRTLVKSSADGVRAEGLITAGDTYGSGADNDSTPQQFVLSNYPDTAGTTSEITYTPTVAHEDANTWYINRTVGFGNSGGHESGYSWITVMEVAS